jgi:hypothetical protein
MSVPKTAPPDESVGQLACVACGYLLRGHRADDRCPECGGTVQLTLDAQRLGTWPPQWLRRLRFGLRLLAGAVALGWFPALAFVFLTPSMLWFWNEALFESVRLGRYEWTLGPPLLIAFALAVWGTLVVTFSEAARLVAAERPRAPWLARAGIVVGLVGFVVLAMTLSGLARGAMRDRMIWVWLALLIGGGVATWNLCTCLARLARRMPDERLAQRCESFRWVTILTIALVAFEAFNFWAVIAWLPITSRRAWWDTLGVVDALIVTGRVALLVAGIVALSVLRAYLRRLNGLFAGAGV